MRIRAILILAGALLLAGCEDDPVKAPKELPEGSAGCRVSDYGNGVFYFHCTMNFGQALAEFRKTHEVVTLSSYASGDLGTTGYWVICK